jgi:hypothetical protein
MWYGTADGRKWGVAISSKDPPQYPNFILNKISVEHLIKTKKSGKIDKAHVVLAKREGANSFSYLGHLGAEKVYEDLKDVRPMFGRSGMEFWILPSSITGDDDGDPF